MSDVRLIIVNVIFNSITYFYKFYYNYSIFWALSHPPYLYFPIISISDLEEMILNNCSSHPLFECITELVKSVRFQFPVKMEEHPDFSKLRSAASQCDRKVPRRSRTRWRLCYMYCPKYCSINFSTITCI